MSKRKNKISGELGVFLQQYARKAHAGLDPNDRTYDRELEKKIKAMSAEELGELMAGQDESLTIDEENEWYSQSLVPGLCYRLNDPVQVTLGGSTKMGSIVSLLAIRPLPKYLVELSDGTDIEVYENGIKPSNHQTIKPSNHQTIKHITSACCRTWVNSHLFCKKTQKSR